MNINKNNVYYLSLGIGIGMFITSLLNLCHFDAKYTRYNDEQIRQMAGELGMISIKDAINENEKQKHSISEENIQDKTSESDERIQKSETETISFIISKGDSSEEIVDNLYQQGIIEDKEELINVIINKNVMHKFNYGNYDIEKGIDYESLVRILADN